MVSHFSNKFLLNLLEDCPFNSELNTINLNKSSQDYLKANFALERLDTGVDVRVLLEPRRGGKGLPALGTGVAAGADVLRADVTLKV